MHEMLEWTYLCRYEHLLVVSSSICHHRRQQVSMLHTFTMQGGGRTRHKPPIGIEQRLCLRLLLQIRICMWRLRRPNSGSIFDPQYSLTSFSVRYYCRSVKSYSPPWENALHQLDGFLGLAGFFQGLHQSFTDLSRGQSAN